MEISHDQKSRLDQPSTALCREYQQTITAALTHRRRIFDHSLRHLSAQSALFAEVAHLLVKTLHTGHKILVAGNGGSAAEAQHFAAELVGRFKRERIAFAAMSLATDTAILTAIANDYGFQEVFARQVQALGQPDDVLLVFSTSGESENLLAATHMSHRCRMNVIAVTGCAQSRLGKLADLVICAPGIDTATAQELHMVTTHILCDIVEAQLSSDHKKDDDVANACACIACHEEST